MARFPYDRSSKWLLQHHGDSLLRLAGLTDIEQWRPLPAEVVQPRQLPDGLLEVRRAGRSETELFVVELSTYPDRRVPRQLLDDLVLVYLDRGVLPEVLVVVLHPKDNVRVADFVAMSSPNGWTHWRAEWRVVELWTLPAEPLLASEDPGLMPWVPLARIDGPPEPVFRRCREVIDRKAAPEEHDNLLAVSQVLAGLRYDDPGLLAIMGGREGMAESLVLKRYFAEGLHKAALGILADRFGTVPAGVEAALRSVIEEDRLQELIRFAVRCPDLATFHQEALKPIPPTPDEGA